MFYSGMLSSRCQVDLVAKFCGLSLGLTAVGLGLALLSFWPRFHESWPRDLGGLLPLISQETTLIVVWTLYTVKNSPGESPATWTSSRKAGRAMCSRQNSFVFHQNSPCFHVVSMLLLSP